MEKPLTSSGQAGLELDDAESFPSPSEASPARKKMKACLISCHPEALELFPSSEANGVSVKNTRIVKGTLRIWLEEHTPNFSEMTWICGSCLQFAQAIVGGETRETLQTAKEDELVRNVIKIIRSGKMKKANLLTFSEALGSLALAETRGIVAVKEPPINNIIALPYSQRWQQGGPSVLKCFLEAASNFRNVTSDQEREAGTRHLVKAVDNLCVILSPRFINPSALAETVVLHSVTGSRFACDFLSKSNASGGHSYMTRVIDSIASSPPEFPRGDIFIAFDNQQIVGREYRVKAGGGQRISLATTICVYKEDVECNVQSNFPISSYLPVPSSDPTVLWNLFEAKKNSYGRTHREHRQRWLRTRLELIAEEYSKCQGNLQDESAIANILSPGYENGLQYDLVEHKPSSCKVTDIKSMMVNPNSYATITMVLDKMLEMNEASDPSRKWFCLYCDGLPHAIAWKIMQSTYQCTTCKSSGNQSDLEDHCCSASNVRRKYEKIILRPGAGHIEVNLVRTIFNEYFDIFIKPIAKKLGFNTPRSLEYCKSALDHHKSWQILKIIYVSLTDELFHLFCKGSVNDHNFENFATWMSTQTNPNIRFALDFVSNVLHPLFLFRSGIRQCNDDVAYAALYRASPLFYGFNHPKYRELMAREIFHQLTLPKLGSPLASRLGFRMCNSKHGQGLDFLLEERNKQQKQWVFAKGPPTEDQWKRASSSLTVFESIKERVLSNVGMYRDAHRPRMRLGDEYIAARIHFRSVLAAPPMHLSTFEEDTVEVNPNFANTSKYCLDNMDAYLRSFLVGKKCPLTVVSATNLETYSMDEILKSTKKLIRQLPTGMKGNLEERLAECSSHDDAVELMGDVDDVVRGLDCNFSNSN